MTQSQIIIAIISSSVVAAVLTSIINWLLVKQNYKNDYYKIILEKRINAYENMNSLVSEMSVLTNMGDYLIPTICFTVESFDNFQIKLALSVSDGFWLSSELSSKLSETNVYLLNNISNKISTDPRKIDIDEKYNESGKLELEQVRAFRKSLQTIMNSDFKKLYDVRSFLNSYKVGGPEHAVMKY